MDLGTLPPAAPGTLLVGALDIRAGGQDGVDVTGAAEAFADTILVTDEQQAYPVRQWELRLWASQTPWTIDVMGAQRRCSDDRDPGAAQTKKSSLSLA